jgi:hypothetical protein
VRSERTQTDTRAQAIKELLNQFTLCQNAVFDCSDSTLQPGNFEQISPLDIKPSQNDRQSQISSLLKARSRVNLQLKIAERMLQQLKTRING